MNAPTDLQTLAALHQAAKENEAFARAARQRIEDQIVALTGLQEYGQKTVNAPGFKVTVKPNYSYSLDQAAYDQIADQIPLALSPITYKREPNESRIRALKADHPDLYARLAMALTVKPTRPTVEIKHAE